MSAGRWRAPLVLFCLAWAAPVAAAEGPPPAEGPTREEILRDLRRLAEELRATRSELEQLRNTVPIQASAVVTVPAGARQGTPFNTPAPDFGPSTWTPSWPPVVNPSPQARERLPRELGAAPPPTDGPLDYPQFVPGILVVDHTLGATDVTVNLALPHAENSMNLQVDPNRILVRASSPPDGTVKIWNYTEYPVTVRWVARRVGN